MLDIKNISYKNKKTWDLIQSGYTVGVFQLESNLGQTWARKIKPKNINELSALVALMRPAGLETGMIQHYCNIKHGEEPKLTFDDEKIDAILAPTYSVLCFQEQMMKFGGDLAWCHLPHLERLIIIDKLRKGIGKKDSKLIGELKESFLEGFVLNGRTRELGEKLFSIIESAGRYAFNDAHAKKYAVWGYITAYLKANYPYEFYTAYMTYSKSKQKPKEELRNLINEAKLLGIQVLPPSVKDKNKEFKIVNSNGEKAIRYGLDHIKNVASNDIGALEDFNNWVELFLAHLDKERERKLRRPGVESLISCGACDHFGVHRNVLLDMFKVLIDLSGKEKIYVIEKLKENTSITPTELVNIIIDCGENVSMKRRKEIVLSEAKEIDVNKRDTFTWRADKEKYLLGISITCSAIDDTNAIPELSCKECHNSLEGNKHSRARVAVVIEEIIPLKTKRGKTPGQEMAQLLISDNTSQLRVACFPLQFAEVKQKLHQDLTYEMFLEGTGGGWCIQKIKQL